MNPNGKPRVIKDYDNLSDQLKDQVMMSFPDGFTDHLISFTNRDGTNTRGILFELEDKIYFVRLNADYSETTFYDDEDDYQDDDNDELASHSDELSDSDDI